MSTASTATGTYPVPVRKYDFSHGFVFGAATSAEQIEGAQGKRYGRGDSIWEEFARNHPDLTPFDTACDHYRRMPSDVRLMKRIGLQAYRFSISWPRVLPDGRGKVNAKGLDFYDRLVDNLLDAGIEPFATGYHWDLPLALQKQYGGWLSREVPQFFADYMAVCAHRLGDRLKNWGTLNEPEVILAGYIGRGMAPEYNCPQRRVEAGHNLMLAHGHAVRALRSTRSDLNVGITLNLVPIDPASPRAKKAAQRVWMRNYAWYLEALLKGSYPDITLDEAARNGFVVQPGDMALISQKLDYLGINWYTRFVVDEKERFVEQPGEHTQMGWEIYPRAFDRMLIEMQREYQLPPVYITENGAALDDTLADGRIHDAGRMRYIHEHLEALERAARAGVDLRGYFIWSLMDNIEWPLGFSKTFGIIGVDRATQKRTVKDSGFWYRDVIAANAR